MDLTRVNSEATAQKGSRVIKVESKAPQMKVKVNKDKKKASSNFQAGGRFSVAKPAAATAYLNTLHI